MRADDSASGLTLIFPPSDLPRHELDIIIEVEKIVSQRFPKLHAFDCVQPP